MKITVLYSNLAAPVLLVAGLLCSLPARADLVFSLESGVTAAPGSTGNTFDVLLTNTGASAVTVGGFGFEINTTDTGITFTGATTSTVTETYIFAGNSLFGPTISTSSPGQTLDASDNVANPGTGTSIAAGQTFGLGNVSFDVAGGAATEIAPVTFNSSFNSLADNSGGTLAFTTTPGTIDITSTAPVPEPAYSGLALCIVLGSVLALRRRKIGAR